MPSSLEHFFARIASAFLDGDLEQLSSLYHHPLAVFENGEIRIESSPQATRSSIQRRRAVARRAGVVEIRALVEDVGDTTLERFPVLVSWDYLDAKGARVEHSRLRYYCSKDNGGRLRIEILEFLEQAFPGA